MPLKGLMDLYCETGERHETRFFKVLSLNGKLFKYGTKIHITDNNRFIGLVGRWYCRSSHRL